MTTRVVKGSMWTLAGQVAPLAVSLLATPFTIRLFGPESYGVFILVSIIPSYMAFADFGMSIASTKFASQAYAEGNKLEEGRIVRSAVLIALVILIPSSASLFILSPWLISAFSIPTELQSEATAALRITSVTFIFSTLCGVVNTPQLTRLRMDLNSLVNSVPRIIGLVLTPLVLYLGFGLVGAVVAVLFASLFNFSGHLIASAKLLPGFLGASIDKTKIKPLLRFGSGMVLGSVAGILLVNAEKGILAASVSPEALAHYSVAFTFANMLTLFSVSMIQSLIPAFSQLQGDAKEGELSLLFSRCVKLSLIWSIPAIVLLGLVGKTFFTIWAGEQFGRESTIPLYVLLLGLITNILAWIPYTAIMASGRPEVLARLYWIELVPYTALVWFLSSRFGAVGAAIAWSIRVIVDACAQFVLAKRLAGIGKLSLRFTPILIAFLVMVVPLPIYLVQGEIDVLVIACTAIALAAYLLIVWSWILEAEESSWIINRVRRLTRVGSSG